MTFTYDVSNPTDITRVRYHLADTVAATAVWTDEEIQFVINEQAGNWKAAVVSLLEQYMVVLSKTPDFKADWLTINSSNPIDALQMMVADKRREFGLPRMRSTAVHVYRADSNADGPPEY